MKRRAQNLLVEALLKFNAVLAPLVAIGSILVFMSRGDNSYMLITGSALILLSPLLAFIIVVKFYKPRKSD